MPTIVFNSQALENAAKDIADLLRALRNRAHVGNPAVSLSKENLPKLVVSGLGVGVLSGFFGIGGGFLIVPAL